MRKAVTADELVWIFYEELRAHEGMEAVSIAIVPESHGWRALAARRSLKRIPKLAATIVKIEKRLQQRYSLKAD